MADLAYLSLRSNLCEDVSWSLPLHGLASNITNIATIAISEGGIKGRGDHIAYLGLASNGGGFASVPASIFKKIGHIKSLVTIGIFSGKKYFYFFFLAEIFSYSKIKKIIINIFQNTHNIYNTVTNIIFSMKISPIGNKLSKVTNLVAKWGVLC